MGKVVSKVLGGVLGAPKPPKASTVAVDQTEEEKKKAKRANPVLVATRGGVAGQELLQGQVSSTGTTFGN